MNVSFEKLPSIVGNCLLRTIGHGLDEARVAMCFDARTIAIGGALHALTKSFGRRKRRMFDERV